MQFLSLLLALLVSTIAAEPGQSPPGYSMKPKCHTTSTCKAYYTTVPTVYKSEVTVTKTKTVYKPETTSKEYTSTYTSTIVYTITKTKTKVEHSTKKIPYKTKTYKTICRTTPEWIWTYTTKVINKTLTWPYPVTRTKEECETTDVYSTYVTSTPCPETYVTSYEKDCTGYKTETKTWCKTSTSCDTWGQPPPYHTPAPTYG